MRIVITGAGGMLGTDLVEELQGRHEVLPFGRADLDVTDFELTRSKIKDACPDTIIHAAAYTDVDGAETNQDVAYEVNAIGTQNVALAAQEVKAPVVYISTDYVFDGQKKSPYHEFDPPNPQGTYAKSKLAGERYVQTLLDRFFVVRTSWLFGRTGRNFVKTILKRAKEGNVLRVVHDQVGSPTYTRDLAKEISRLIPTHRYGLYHITNQGSCSWYEFAAKILELSGIQVELIPTTTQELARPAPRPAYSVLANLCLELTFGRRMRPWEEALQGHLIQSA
ncbi:MAG: dTDP-4-dehydrorhamnose reductase [bacterium]|nr:dTDP-4-dehydrorhamnose reductase [bacterium]